MGLQMLCPRWIFLPHSEHTVFFRAAHVDQGISAHLKSTAGGFGLPGICFDGWNPILESGEHRDCHGDVVVVERGADVLALADTMATVIVGYPRLMPAEVGASHKLEMLACASSVSSALGEIHLVPLPRPGDGLDGIAERFSRYFLDPWWIVFGPRVVDFGAFRLAHAD